MVDLVNKNTWEKWDNVFSLTQKKFMKKKYSKNDKSTNCKKVKIKINVMIFFDVDTFTDGYFSDNENFDK